MGWGPGAVRSQRRALRRCGMKASAAKGYLKTTRARKGGWGQVRCEAGALRYEERNKGIRNQRLPQHTKARKGDGGQGRCAAGAE